MKITMIARLLVRSQRKGVFDREGNKAIMTLGIVSPTMMQKAIMPPKALFAKSEKRLVPRLIRTKPIELPETYIQREIDACGEHTDRYSDKSWFTEAMLHCRLE